MLGLCLEMYPWHYKVLSAVLVSMDIDMRVFEIASTVMCFLTAWEGCSEPVLPRAKAVGMVS